MAVRRLKPARALRRAATDRRGQTVVEFTIVLTLFLGVLFVVLTFIMLMSMGQMTLYTTFMSARAASVDGDYEAAAEELMPRISMHPMYEPARVTMRGEHRMPPYLTGGGGGLANPLRDYLTLRSRVTLHRWPTCTGAGDNPIPCP